MLLCTCRAMLLWCHRAPSPRSHWGAFRPALSAGTLTPPPSSSELEPLQLEWPDLELESGQCLAVSSSVMLGLCWEFSELQLSEQVAGYMDSLCLCSLQEPISEAAAVLIRYPGFCPLWSHGTVLFDGCFPYPVCYVKLLSQHLHYQCDEYIFYCGYQNCSVLVSWKCTFSTLSDTVKQKHVLYKM